MGLRNITALSSWRNFADEDCEGVGVGGEGGGTMNLAERRAWFVYEAARIENKAAGRPINPEEWFSRDEQFRRNMIRAVAKQCGVGRVLSCEKLHDNWVKAYEKMGWKYGPVRDVKLKTHPDMVPFEKLGRKEREKDWVFFMLCEIAREMR